jgi:hypothetical protein
VSAVCHFQKTKATLEDSANSQIGSLYDEYLLCKPLVVSLNTKVINPGVIRCGQGNLVSPRNIAAPNQPPQIVILHRIGYQKDMLQAYSCFFSKNKSHPQIGDGFCQMNLKEVCFVSIRLR